MTERRNPAYRIETPRLVLRCWDPADAPLLKTAVEESLDHLLPWMPWAEQEPTDLATKVRLLRTFRSDFDGDRDYVYGIFDPAEEHVLGGSGLHTRRGDAAREIGYWIHRDHAGRGLITEATAALVRMAFEHDGVDRVEIHCRPDNVRSAAVPRKLGFSHEATLRRRTLGAGGQPEDAMVWTLFAAEYRSSPAATAPLRAYGCLGEILLDSLSA